MSVTVRPLVSYLARLVASIGQRHHRAAPKRLTLLVVRSSWRLLSAPGIVCGGGLCLSVAPS